MPQICDRFIFVEIVEKIVDLFGISSQFCGSRVTNLWHQSHNFSHFHKYYDFLQICAVRCLGTACYMFISPHVALLAKTLDTSCLNSGQFLSLSDIILHVEICL